MGMVVEVVGANGAIGVKVQYMYSPVYDYLVREYLYYCSSVIACNY